MKTRKILLATTTLCLAAGTAAAEVALSGGAEMGVVGSKNNSERFFTDVNVKFKMSGVTDGGIEFGTAVELSEVSDDDDKAGEDTGKDYATGDNDEHGGIEIFIKDPDGFGSLAMGDTDGAYDWALSEIVDVGGGSIDDAQEHGAYDGNGGLDGTHDGQILRYDRAVGSGFSFAASVELDDDDNGNDEGGESDDPVLGIGGKYTMGMGMGELALGGGFQATSSDRSFKLEAGNVDVTAEADATVVGGSVSMDFTGGGDGFKTILNASVLEADASVTADSATTTLDVEQTYLGLGLGYHVGGVELGVNVASKVTEGTYNGPRSGNDDVASLETTVTGVGFAATYDLGGGASLQFGVGSSETENDYTVGGAWANNETLSGPEADNGLDTSSSTNKWSLGLAFSF